MVLTTEATYHSRKILCIIDAGFLLLVVGGTVPGASGDDVITSTSVDNCFTSSSVTPPHLDLTFFSAGLCPPACLLFYSAYLCHNKVPYIPLWNSTHIQQLLHCRP